jgi:hypothetical protein
VIAGPAREVIKWTFRNGNLTDEPKAVKTIREDKDSRHPTAGATYPDTSNVLYSALLMKLKDKALEVRKP